ncbi:MAG TPA: hypothetical protein V6C97_01970, partial [Oculatellaceae cyanobacterium]
MAKITVYVDDHVWSNFKTQVFQKHGTLRSLSKEVEKLLESAIVENQVTLSFKNIYQQMATAYQAGAKYIILFNYPALEGNNYGIMQNEHFEAIQDFWKNATEGKLKFNTTKAQAAMVLPTNYGWAMRRPDDRIWGFWGADE